MAVFESNNPMVTLALSFTPPVITDRQLEELAEQLTVRKGLTGELLCLLQAIRKLSGLDGLSESDSRRLLALRANLDQRVSLELYQSLLEDATNSHP